MSVTSGWRPIGRYYPVNRMKKNRLFEIDGKSALEFYTEHFGSHLPAASHVSLAVYREPGGDFCLRDSFAGHHEEGAVEFIGTFPEKPVIRLTTVFREDVIEAGERAINKTLSAMTGEPDIVFVFSSMSRRHILGSRINEELEGLLGRQGMPFFGFYCYGEIAPVELGRRIAFQNDSYVAVALREVAE